MNFNQEKKILNENINNEQNINNEEEEEIENQNDEDDRLSYVLITLGLEDIIQFFEEKNITFVDLLFLSKEDMRELQLEMYQRNRIFSFSKLFSKNAKEYSIKEISDFFTNNKQFIFNSVVYEKVTMANEEEYYNNQYEHNNFLQNNSNININNNNNNLNKRINDKSNLSNNEIKNKNNKNVENLIRKKENKSKSAYQKYLEIKQNADMILEKINKQKEESFLKKQKYNNLISKSKNKKSNNEISYND